jgi:hypothetical protein
MHGFLNLLAAATVAFEGGECDDVRRALADLPVPSAAPLEVRDPHDFRRRFFRAFASCDYHEPLADLRRLRLL